MTEDEVETRAAIEAVLQRQMTAWDAGDADAFSADVRKDVVFTNVLGMFVVGKSGFDRQHEHIFGSFYKGSRMRQIVEHIALIRADVAIVDTLTEVEGGGPFPPGFPRQDGVTRTRLEQVMVHEGGRWWVAAFHNVAVPPAARAAPAP